MLTISGLEVQSVLTAAARLETQQQMVCSNKDFRPVAIRMLDFGRHACRAMRASTTMMTMRSPIGKEVQYL